LFVDLAAGPPEDCKHLDAKDSNRRASTVVENPDGSFGVSPGELITVTVTRTKPPCMAIFSRLDGATWNPEVDPNPQTRVRSFQSPTKVKATVKMELIVDFVGIQAGGTPSSDQYIVVIKGQTGDPSADTVDPSDIPQSLPYTFSVNQP